MRNVLEDMKRTLALYRLTEDYQICRLYLYGGRQPPLCHGTDQTAHRYEGAGAQQFRA